MTPERATYMRRGLAIYIAWIATFQLVGTFASTLPTVDLTTPLDRMIPFTPLFIWPYELCYVLPIFAVLVASDWHRVNRGLIALLLVNVAAFAVYLAVPVAFAQPTPGRTLAERMVALEYAWDFHPGANNMPSLHVALSWIVVWSCAGRSAAPALRVLGVSLAGAVTVATLFVKQHIIPDVVSGVLVAAGAWAAAGRIYPRLADPAGDPVVQLRRFLVPSALATLGATAALVAVRLAVNRIGS